jgi:hypothetical protein
MPNLMAVAAAPTLAATGLGASRGVVVLGPSTRRVA